METTNNPKSTKPIKAKPHFYSVCLEGLMNIAKEHGYNLVVHGSMSRDFDLVAIPWIDEPKSHIEMLDAFCEFLGVRIPYTDNHGRDYQYSLLGGGRSSYVINLNRGGRFNGYLDAEYYLDISITPLMPRP
jgi:hypothetical protein